MRRTKHMELSAMSCHKFVYGYVFDVISNSSSDDLTGISSLSPLSCMINNAVSLFFLNFYGNMFSTDYYPSVHNCIGFWLVFLFSSNDFQASHGFLYRVYVRIMIFLRLCDHSMLVHHNFMILLSALVIKR